MAVKKYLSLERLEEYDSLIKEEIASGDEAVKSYVNGELEKKANASHDHSSLYYGKSEVDTKISGVNSSITTHTGNTDIHVTTTNKSNWNSAYTHSTSAHAPSNAERNIVVGIQKNGTDLTVDSSTRKVNITVPTTAAEIGAATAGHKHDDLYDAKGSSASALASAQAYADSAATTVKNDLLNGAGAAYDTLKELGDLIVDNADAIEALETIASGKANATHSHAIADVSGLQSALDGKAAASHGTHVTYSTTAPNMDGTASVGTATTVSRSDHVHPTDTSRASKVQFDEHTSNTTKHITADERTNWNAAKTHADSAHAPSNAQANVIESIKVNGTAQTVTSKAVNITVPTKASDIGAAADSHTHAISDITNLQTTLNNASSAISANISSITALTDRTAALETKVGDGFVDITSAEIRALFA